MRTPGGVGEAEVVRPGARRDRGAEAGDLRAPGGRGERQDGDQFTLAAEPNLELSRQCGGRAEADLLDVAADLEIERDLPDLHFDLRHAVEPCRFVDPAG